MKIEPSNELPEPVPQSRRYLLKEKLSPWYPESTIDDHNYLLPKPNDQLMIMTGVKQNPGY